MTNVCSLEKGLLATYSVAPYRSLRNYIYQYINGNSNTWVYDRSNVNGIQKLDGYDIWYYCHGDDVIYAFDRNDFKRC